MSKGKVKISRHWPFIDRKPWSLFSVYIQVNKCYSVSPPPFPVGTSLAQHNQIRNGSVNIDKLSGRREGKSAFSLSLSHLGGSSWARDGLDCFAGPPQGALLSPGPPPKVITKLGQVSDWSLATHTQQCRGNIRTGSQNPDLNWFWFTITFFVEITLSENQESDYY